MYSFAFSLTADSSSVVQRTTSENVARIWHSADGGLPVSCVHGFTCLHDPFIITSTSPKLEEIDDLLCATKTLLFFRSKLNVEYPVFFCCFLFCFLSFFSCCVNMHSSWH